MTATILENMASWAVPLALADVPPRVVEQAKSQVFSMLAAVHSGYASDLGGRIARAFPPPAPGPARVLPTGEAASPAHAAFLMSSWSMVLDYDDVLLGGHTGHSATLVPLAYAPAAGRGGADLLLAQIVANEIAARINMVCALGAIRGQMATHLHLIGAAAARAKLEELPEQRFAEALGFALAMPAKALYPAFLGSDAKALGASWPVRMGLEAVDAVQAGLRGNPGLLEDPRGLFATFTRFPVLPFLAGLGTQWHTETNSFKIYPASGYVNAAVDATLCLVREHDVAPEEIDRVDVFGSLFTAGLEAHTRPYADAPEPGISTLTFSTPYAVACAIVDRSFTPEHLRRERRTEPRLRQLAARVRVRHDPRLTLAALLGDIPLGAALRHAARWQALIFLLGMSRNAAVKVPFWRAAALALRVAARAGRREPIDLARSTKPLGARVVFRLRSGRRLAKTVEIPQGFAGSGDWLQLRRLAREKYLRCAIPLLGPAAEQAASLIDDLERLDAAGLRQLVELNGVRATPAPVNLGIPLLEEGELLCDSRS